MCGIVGVAGRTPWPARERLGAMRDTLAHRGPDDHGEWWSADGRVGLGHRRLAIIDLSPGGHQPMRDEGGRLAVVFNGEIYNHPDLRRELEARGHGFRTASDTEVLLAAYREWGEACLERLDGMFAFAIHDAAAGTLLLARDRAGEKPLYYREDGSRLFFASELKALLADPDAPRRLDPEALDHYLCYGYVPGELCLLSGYRKLPPAHVAVFDLGAGRLLRTRAYWELPPLAAEPSGTSVAALAAARLEELESLLLASVRRRLVADVPVGILLSGGVDSGLVAALAARVSPVVNTYTVTLEGHAGLDEGPAARRVAEHLGTRHTAVAAEAGSFDLVPLLARQYDEPLADYSMIPTYLVSRAIRRHANVALGGDGGDELFGGYPHYEWLAWQERARRLLPARARSLVAAAAERALPTGVPGRNHLAGIDGGLARAIAHVNLYFDQPTRERLAQPRPSPGARTPEERRASLCRAGASRIQQATRADFLSTLPDGYLVKVDRASMLASLEVRAPFLDHRVVEFAFGRVPDALKLRGGRRKVLTRALAERLLPKGLDFDTKRGFTVPLASWLAGPWRSGVEEILRAAPPELLAPNEVEAILARDRVARNAGRIYALLMLELWRREYRVTV